jgi:hypothetical protein
MKINKPHFDIKALAYLWCETKIPMDVLQNTTPTVTFSTINILLSATQSIKMVTLLPDPTQQFKCSSELRK